VLASGARRFQPAPIPITALPPLDAIVVSHDHFDHLDRATIVRLAPLGVPFVTALGVGAHLEAWAVPPEQIHELDWWEQATLRGGDLAITAPPAQHFSGRAGGANRTLWASIVIETAKPARVLQRRQPADPAVRPYRRAPRAVRPRDARGARGPLA
jgi:L-ascorbate metabolism protein UlaG (beta-lactamase superfamily)